MQKKWWQNTIIYQVYIRSFKDSNEDGIGDLEGIVSKLDYLKNLGIETVWISPHYQSPMDDFGYDVSDFYQVAHEYGTTENLIHLINETHKRDMKLIVDLILNHTSDEHKWFLAAKDPDHPDYARYHDYYLWHPGKIVNGKKELPTKYVSFFGGPTWDYNEKTDSYYMHIFSKKMPDLNWKNKQLREDIKKMIRHLLDLGIDGFRVDASSHLGRDITFPDDEPGWQYFANLPESHIYLKELGQEIFYPYNIVTLGEAGGANDQEALQYCGYDSKEFNMLIQFSHCWQDCDDSNHITPGKWAKGELNLVKVKESFQKWHSILYQKGWNVIYWHNHDQPRIVSHYGNDSEYREKSAKMLALALYFMPGTPIVYQGEEIGMTNVSYDKLEDYRDVEVFTEYKNFIRFGATHEQAMNAIHDRARDNARSPIQWDDSQYAGFSDVQPWMKVNDNYKEINIAQQEQDNDSLLQLYKQILRYRKEHSLLAFGHMTFFDIKNNDNFIFENKTEEESILVIANFRNKKTIVNLEFIDYTEYDIIFTNNQNIKVEDTLELEPYDSIVLRRKG